MNNDDKWLAIHTYRRAVTNGHAEPIRCPEDETEMVPVVGDRGEPALKCYHCRSVYGIGLHVYEQIKSGLASAVIDIEWENMNND